MDTMVLLIRFEGSIQSATVDDTVFIFKKQSKVNAEAINSRDDPEYTHELSNKDLLPQPACSIL